MSVRNDRRRDFIFAEVDDHVVLGQSYKMKVNTFRYHTTWQDVLIQIKSPNNLDTWNVVWTPKTTFWHNESNETLGPF